MEIMILELLSLVSLIFSGLSLFFNLSGWRLFLLFIYVLSISCLFALKRLQGRWIGLLTILLILPFFLKISGENAIITGTYTLSLLYYHVKVLGRVCLDDLISQFKIVYAAMMGITVFGLLVPRFNPLVMRSLLFMLVYFFTTIILSASIRHKAAGLDPKKNRKKLLLYIGLALIFSLIVGVSQIRLAIFSFMGLMAGFLLKGLYAVLYPILYGMSWLLTKIIGLIAIPLNMEYEEEEVLGGIEEGITETAERVKESPIVEVILLLVVGALILFFIIRFIKAMREKKPSTLPYEEQRDFILETTDKKKRKRRDKLPSDAKGQVRYYYREYLRRLEKQVLLEKQDTSLSIKNKGEDILGQNEEIRNLYIRYRYTDHEADEKAVEAMKNLCDDK